MDNNTFFCITHSSDETKQCAALLASLLEPGDAVVLSGDLGAGKTQFTQGLAAALGISGPVVSPTFTILLEYHGGALPLYHFDLYRLECEDDLEDIGYYEAVEGDGVSLIEWGDKFPDCLPEEYVDLAVLVQPDESRVLRIGSVGRRGEQLAGAWAKQPGMQDYVTEETF